MKKILLICTGIIFFIALIGWTVLVVKQTKDNGRLVKVDLSRFSGRVLPEADVHPGIFSIRVPMAEALKYGKDAILTYGEDGIRIWKPDTSTAGTFLYAYTENIGLDIFKAFKVKSIGIKEIVLERFYTSGTYAGIVAGFLLLAMLSALPFLEAFNPKWWSGDKK